MGLISNPCTAEQTEQGSTSPISALLIDGQNNHKWQETTPLIVAALESGGLCDVTVITSPAKKAPMDGFEPNFADYDVVVLNYNGDPWPEATKQAFEAYVAGGGGMVSVHAADNSFPKWHAYNRMIGLGGWNGRNEKDGPYVRWQEDTQTFTRDLTPGSGGQHGKRSPFVMVVRDADHPITAGLPGSFSQTEDELYGKLRGPAENMHVLATAYSNPATRGTGEHEPILMTIHFGEGRVFHTTLGHDAKAMNGRAFQITLRRGTQWAAIGAVTLPIVDPQVLPADAPAVGDPASVANLTTSDALGTTIPDLDADDWKSLFDGKSLKGWTQKNGTASYRAEGGAIVGLTAIGSPNSFLCTDQTYKNFELTFEANVDPGLNSGVQIRSQTRPKGGRVFGPQVEIEASPGEAGYIYGEATGRGWITKEQPVKDAYQNGQFNRFRVRAMGERIQTWIGDQLIADVSDPELSKEGFIGLQVHSIKKDAGPFEVRWRDIKIRTLSAD
ncbi:MAG: family 16 glycoside hydrolase [Planctomycetota bacterium]